MPFFRGESPRESAFSPLRASDGLDSSLAEIDQPLQVVAGRHHRHRKVRPRPANRADHLATHLLDGRKHVLDAHTGLGDAMIAPLLAFGQWLVALALSLDLVPKAVRLQPGFALVGRVTAIRIDGPIRVGGIERPSPHEKDAQPWRGRWP